MAVARWKKSTLARSVLSAWAWLALAATVLLMLPVIALVRVITAPFDKGRYWVGLTFRKVAVIACKANPMWHFKVSGNIPTDPRRPYMVVSNHESFVDILLIAHLPFDMKWLSKDTFFKIPVVGWEMSLAGDIKLQRGSKKSRAQALVDMKQRLGQKVPVMVFPEGTRSQTGELGQFHDGAFKVAIQAGVPVLPLAVVGTRSALIKKDWRFGFSDAEVVVLEPIETTGLTKGDVPQLTETVRSRIAEARKQLAAQHGLALPDADAA